MGRGRPGTGVEALATSIRVSFTWNGKRCRENLDIKPTASNMKHAARLVRDVKEQIRNGTFDYAKAFPASKRADSGTFGEFADKWLELQPLEYSTKMVYRNYLNVWRAVFDGRQLNTITTDEIMQVLIDRKAEGLSPKTINNSIDPLRGIFATAMNAGTITFNPVAFVKRLKMQKTVPDPFSKEEMDRILAWMDRYAPDDVRAWYTVAFTTGLRPSEQCVLRRDDLKDGQLKIERAHVRGRMKATKTYSVRFVDLSPRAAQELTRLTGEYVFSRPDGSFHTEPTLRAMHIKYWTTCLAELGVRYRSPYHTRHTYATVNLMAGVNPAYIARQLGHSSMALLLSTYSRWIDGADGGAERAKVAAAFAHGLPTAA